MFLEQSVPEGRQTIARQFIAGWELGAAPSPVRDDRKQPFGNIASRRIHKNRDFSYLEGVGFLHSFPELSQTPKIIEENERRAEKPGRVLRFGLQAHRKN